MPTTKAQKHEIPQKKKKNNFSDNLELSCFSGKSKQMKHPY
ncbi:MAG: hypothetical protein U9R19_17000 [Bacteroidota bacterium]|nr:hypothetical protein [Bacteroidota bacterium]